ncbi:oligosaccharide flippase family protein [Mucilaginibacter sp. Mucisp86]|uniref:oligosaccharide flippase family protein n=1 Tax=Mucilaginibacter sp. Mucisp86 TaxID=3243060 RepID=UPI0039B5FC3F
MSTAKKFAGQTAIYGISTIITRSLYFILTPIYVGLLSAKVYGVFTKMYSWASLLTAILSFGMETTFFRYINKYQDKRTIVYSNSLVAVVFTCIIFLVAVFMFISPMASWLSDGNSATINDYVFYIKTLSIVLAIDAICIVPFALIRFNGKPKRYATIKILNIVFVVTLNLFFLYGIPVIIKQHFMGSGWFEQWYRPHWVGYIFLANMLSSIFTFLMLIPELSQFRPKFNGDILREMLIYSWPIFIANISYIINENLDKIMLGKLLPPTISEQQVGIYGACAKISLFLSLFVQAFRLGAEPFFFSHAKNKNAGETYAKIMNYFVIVVSVIFVGLVANIEILKYFIKGHDPVQQAIYWSGLGVVPLLLFGYVSLGIYMNLSVWYKLSDQTKYGLYISGIGAILTIILNIIYIPKYSYMASAWISLIAYTVMMLLSYIWGQKNYPIPYKLKKNGAYILSSLIIVFVSFVVFKRNLIIGNGLLVLFLTAIVLIEKKDFAALLKRKN